ncbi:NUDIX domain-containing protein [Pseudarthrobacter sp. J64]|uniref:NUDIX hydrolase n=1 Tax=Pseudarthrobacter sp. J64 TaxID=3116485 RepID=UPI002E807A0D|nr:NUDIX domain-containing protein [Pseudarthrobacter sp. J64]MEE2568949.1 NUDIX domain-containing protein [Pseudarthrobacter sp. J64]
MTDADNTPDAYPVPVEARLAASVILVRDAADPAAASGPRLEVFIQHRVSTMDFAAGMVVFPGGRVDAVDGSGWDFPTAVVQVHAKAWHRTGEPESGADTVVPVSKEDAASRLLAAARREVFEETGLMLDADSLVPWANWVTPPDQPKRFDTYFFLAALRPGQEPRHQTTEASTSQWMAVADILAAEAAGTLQLMRPTKFLLEELLTFGSAAAAVSAVRDIVPVRGPRGTRLT